MPHDAMDVGSGRPSSGRRRPSASTRSASRPRGFPNRTTPLKDWLARGYHGEMAWMARAAERRTDASRSLEGALTARLLRIELLPGAPVDAAPGFGVISSYAQGEDYHRVLEEKLKEVAAFIESAGLGPDEDLRRHRPSPREELRRRRRPRVARQALEPPLPRGKLLVLSRRDPRSALPRTVGPRARPLRHLHPLHRGLSYRGDRRALRRRQPSLHLLPDHRAPRVHSPRAPAAHRKPDLRMRRLPGRLPLEPLRREERGPGLPPAGAPRLDGPRRDSPDEPRGVPRGDARERDSPRALRGFPAERGRRARERARPAERSRARRGPGARGAPRPRPCRLGPRSHRGLPRVGRLSSRGSDDESDSQVRDEIEWALCRAQSSGSTATSASQLLMRGPMRALTNRRHSS